VSIPMSDMQCSLKCGRKLAKVNTNPEGMCGICQRHMKRGTARWEVWEASGRKATWAELAKAAPIIKLATPRGPNGFTEEARRTITSHLPAVGRLPTAYLMECVAEFQRRVKEAERVTALAHKVFTKSNP
jgi:hypothetical protein